MATSEEASLVQKLAPYLDKAADFVDLVTPHAKKAANACKLGWEKLQPYKPKEWGPTLFGILLVFFGGRFLTTVAAFEAIRLIGVKSVLVHTQKLWANYQAGRELAAKDEKDGRNKKNDDSEMVRANSMVSHETKTMVVTMLRACDPQQVIEALTGLYSILLSVVATLRFKFAAAVTLGCSLGDMMCASVHTYGKPILVKNLSPELHKWIDPGISLVCQGIGVSLAWLLQRVISALHCSMRGAYIVVTQSQQAAVRLGYLQKPVLTESAPMFSLVVTMIGGLGFLNQVAYGFSMPLVLQPFFLPLYVLESILTYTIGSV